MLRQWGRLPDLERTVRRFPVASAWVVALWALVVGRDAVAGDELLFKAMLGVVLAAYLAVAVQLAAESSGRAANPVRHAVGLALGLGGLGLCLVMEELPVLAPLLVLAVIVGLGNAAWWGRARDDARLWEFTRRLWTGAMFATVGSVIFFGGTFAILLATNALFGIRLDDLASYIILPLGLALLAPLYWMGTLPDPRTVECEVATLGFEARAIGFLGVWLLAPLVAIYGLVVLAYAVQIVVARELPSNQIGAVVSPFLAIGLLTWLVLEPEFLRRSAWVRLFRRAWFPVMFVSALLVAVAVGVRVGEYGWTWERFALAAYVAAALVVAGWFTLRPRDGIRIPTAAVAGFLVAVAFLAKPVSDLSQRARLEAALAEGDSVGVYTGLRYLALNDRADWIADIFPDAPSDNVYDEAWDAYLSARGINPEANAVAPTRNSVVVYEAEDSPLDVGLTPIFQGSYSVSVEGRQEPLQGGSDDPPTWRGETLTLVVGAQPVTLRVDDADDLFTDALRREAPDVTGDVRLPAPSFQTRTGDGREALVVVSNLRLFGNEGRLSGGSGEVWLFTSE